MTHPYVYLILLASASFFSLINSQQPSSPPTFIDPTHRKPSHETTNRQTSNNTSPKSSSTPLVTPSKSPLPYKIGRRFWISSKGETSQILGQEQDFTQSILVLTKFFSYVETSLTTFLQTKREPPAEQALRPCALESRNLLRAMKNWFVDRGIPTFADGGCLTELIGTAALANESESGDYTFTPEELMKALELRDAAVRRNALKIADATVRNWSTPTFGEGFPYSTESDECIIRSAAGVRVGSKWYVQIGITNDAYSKNLRLFERFFLSEVIHVKDNGQIGDPLRVLAQKRPPDGSPPDAEHIWIDNTTTVLAAGQGSVKASLFGGIYIEEIPALHSALEMMDLAIQQAQDAVAPSSLAILFLPLFLNLVPIALIAQVQTKFMLLYTVMTDMVTVIPLGIKGVEMIHIGKTVHTQSSFRISSPVNGSIDQAAAVQLYVAQCGSHDNVLTLGIVFLAIACAAMIVGVALEFIASACVTRRRLRTVLGPEHEPLVVSPTTSQPQSQQVNTAGAVGATFGRGDFADEY